MRLAHRNCFATTTTLLLAISAVTLRPTLTAAQERNEIKAADTSSPRDTLITPVWESPARAENPLKASLGTCSAESESPSEVRLTGDHGGSSRKARIRDIARVKVVQNQSCLPVLNV